MRGTILKRNFYVDLGLVGDCNACAERLSGVLFELDIDDLATFGDFIQIIRPILHHGAAFGEEFGAVIGCINLVGVVGVPIGDQRPRGDSPNAP